MLKHQVKTMSNRDRVSRKPVYKLFEELSLSGVDSTDSQSLGSLGTNDSAPSPTPSSSEGGLIMASQPHHQPIVAMRSCQLARRKLRSASVSSLSSGGSSNSEPGSMEWGTLRVYTHSLRADSDYKTMYINSHTTTGELIEMILAKFAKYRSKLTDPNLFSLCMEVYTRTGGGRVETVMRLEPNSKPLELQSFHPIGQSRFVLNVEEGTRVRVYDKHLSPELNYKCLLISERTTCSDVIKLLVQSQKVFWPLASLQLVAVYLPTECQQPLPGEERLSYVLTQPWWDDQYYQVHLKPVQYFRLAGKLGAVTNPEFESV